MKEIKATAPTPQDWIELVRESERLNQRGDDYLVAMQKSQEVADAAVQAGLYQQKRAEASELEVRRIAKRLELAESCLENGGANRYYEELTLENKTND